MQDNEILREIFFKGQQLPLEDSMHYIIANLSQSGLTTKNITQLVDVDPAVIEWWLMEHGYEEIETDLHVAGKRFVWRLK